MSLKPYFKTLTSWGLLRVIEKESLIDEAIKNISLPDKEIQKSLKENWCKKFKIDSNEKLKIWIDKNGFTIEDWEIFISRRWRWASWCQKEFSEKISSYFLERKTFLDKVTYSMLRVKDENLSYELFLRINECEESFSNAVKNFSEGNEKLNNGKIGPISLNQTHPIIARLLQSSQEGKLWAPRKIEDWWIIVKLDKFENATLNNETKQILSLELGENYLNQNIDSKISSLYKNG